MTASRRHPAAKRGADRDVQRDDREKAAQVEACHGYSGEQGGQLGVGSRDKTLEGRHGSWRGNRAGRDDHQAIAQLRRALGNQRDNAGSRGWGRNVMIYGREYQRRPDQHRPRGSKVSMARGAEVVREMASRQTRNRPRLRRVHPRPWPAYANAGSGLRPIPARGVVL